MSAHFTETDHAHMQRAIKLAWQGRFSTSPNPRVGCVIAHGSQIVGQGFHIQAGSPHAEVHALRQAGELARSATAYVTLEPCAHYGRTPPCAQALIDAGVGTVIAAMQDPNPLVGGKGLAMLAAAGIETRCGLLENQARALNRGFLSRIERGRPFVKLKTAVSLDGKTALADGRSQWITGDAARHDVQILRAESCAVLTGIGTVLGDNPRLNVRDFPTLRQPIRIVLDSSLNTPPSSHLVQDGGETWLFAAETADDTQNLAQFPNIRIFRLPRHTNGGLDLHTLLTTLAENGIGELMVEAGTRLASAFLQHNLVDEIVCYQAPKILGGEGAPLFRLPENAAALSIEAPWQTISADILGNDIKWVLARR